MSRPSLPIVCFRASKRTRTSTWARGLIAELGFDLVRAELRERNEPLPRIPPTRFRGGLRYQRNAFQAGGEIISVAKQDRVFFEETPTDGYNLLKLSARTRLVERVESTPSRRGSTMRPTSSIAIICPS